MNRSNCWSRIGQNWMCSPSWELPWELKERPWTPQSLPRSSRPGILFPHAACRRKSKPTAASAVVAGTALGVAPRFGAISSYVGVLCGHDLSLFDRIAMAKEGVSLVHLL